LEKDVVLTETLNRSFAEKTTDGSSLEQKSGKALVKHKSIATLLDLNGMENAQKEMVSRRRSTVASDRNIIKDNKPSNGKTLYIFSEENPIRLVVYKIVTSNAFEYTILALIGTSSLLLAAETPSVIEGSSLDTGLFVTSILFTVLFSIEIVLKVIAFGFLYPTDSAYCRNGWNILDLIVVVISIIGFMIEGSSVDFVKGFRAARALRPLRLIQRAPGLRRVVNTLIKSVPPMANRMLVCLLFLLIFGILGVSKNIVLR
jgi:hypothetical protein